MAYFEPETPFPFPPWRPDNTPFPLEVPWDVPISYLSNWWLERGCQHCGHTGYYPMRLLAAKRGWNVTLRQIVPRLICGNPECRKRPAHIHLVSKATGDDKGPGAKPKLWHDLLAP